MRQTDIATFGPHVKWRDTDLTSRHEQVRFLRGLPFSVRALGRSRASYAQRGRFDSGTHDQNHAGMAER